MTNFGILGPLTFLLLISMSLVLCLGGVAALGLLAGGVTGWLSNHFWLHSSHPLWVMASSAAAGALFGLIILLMSGEAIILLVGSLTRWATTRVSSVTS